MKPISSNLHFYLLSIPMMVLFSISFFAASAQVTESTLKKEKTIFFNGIPVPQGIMDTLATKPEEQAVADFYGWLDEHSLRTRFTTWIDSLLHAQSAPIIIGEKFCDVEFKDGLVSIRNIVVNGQVTNFEQDATNLKQNDMNNLQIIYLKKSNAIYLLGDHGVCYIQLSVSGMEVTSKLWSTSIPDRTNPEVLINSTGDMLLFTTKKHLAVVKVGEWPLKIYAHDGSKFFTHPGATYEDAANGIDVAMTSTTLFFRIKDKQYIWTMEAIVGAKVPPLTKPRVDTEGEYIRIRDPTMNDSGKTFKILYDPRTNQIGLFEDDTLINKR